MLANYLLAIDTRTKRSLFIMQPLTMNRLRCLTARVQITLFSQSDQLLSNTTKLFAFLQSCTNLLVLIGTG